MPKTNAQDRSVKPASGDVTRRRLLTAAASLIVERGWGAVTTRAVADRAGANQALVHYHFGSIDNLRRESVLAEISPAIEELIDELLDDRPLPESIHKVMGLVDRFDLGTDAGVLMAEALLQATRDPAMAQDMARVMGSWAELLGPRLAVAQERGVIRGDIPAEQLTSVLAAFLDGFLIQRMADPRLDTSRTADTLIQLLSSAGEERP